MVYEAGLATGSHVGTQTTSGTDYLVVADSSPNGGLSNITSVTINGTAHGIADINAGNVSFDQGGVHIQITGLDATSGHLNYSYALTAAGADAPVSFTASVTDLIGQTSNVATATINITDDAPVANVDTNAVLEHASIGGNVITGVGETGAALVGADTQSADRPVLVTSVTGATTVAVTGATTNVNVAGAHGTLTIDGNGDYTYQVNPAYHLAAGNTVTDQFNYTIKDADGTSPHISRFLVSCRNLGD